MRCDVVVVVVAGDIFVMSVKASVKTAQDVRLREEEDGGEVFEQRQSRRKGCAGRVVADHSSVGYFVDFPTM